MDECFESLVYSDSDNSEGEGAAEVSTHVPEPNSSLATPEESTQNPDQPIHTNNDTISEDSDEDDMNISIKKTKKSARILSSDDEKENSDNELQTEDKSTTDSQEPTKSTFNVRPSICDSDTKSSSDGNQNDTEIQTKKMNKKLTKKKQKIQKQKQTSDSSESGSESDDESSKDVKKNRKKSNKKQSAAREGSGDSSGSDSSSADSNDQMDSTENVKPREKTVQRMSAKVAEQQMKEIQSESQRMARELHVNIPYHKPKAHSLKEFLSRRSIVQQQEKLASKSFVKAAVAIKMSENELIQYMNDMKKREQEAEEFFQEQETDNNWNSKASDSEESEQGETGDPVKGVEEAEEPPSAGQLKECEDLQQNLIESTPEVAKDLDKPEECVNQETSESVNENENASNEQNNPIETTDVIEIHTNHTELDDELDAMPTNNKKVKLSFPTDFVPKLKGTKGLVIDLETNDVKPMPKTGVDELLERFMENAVVKSQTVETQDIGIFRTDTGSIEKHTIHVNIDNIKPKREPRPGESLFKLRAELGKKIKENREKLIAQRLQEEKEQELINKQMESEDEEEFDDLSDDETGCNEAEEPTKDLNDAEMEPAINENNDEKNDESMESANDSEGSDDSESEIADVEVDINAVQKPRKRILTTLDDDSDNENPISSEPVEENGVSQPIDNHSTQLPSEEGSKGMNISALESEILQLSNVTDPESNKKDSTKLFECDGDYEDIGESQLMELCSGSFATQYLDKESVQGVEQTQKNEPIKVNTQIDETDEVAKAKPVFLSSDEEESEDASAKKKSKKKIKKHILVYSDDEGEQEENEEETKEDDESYSNIEDDRESIEDEEKDLGERYIEYDSDENEVVVELKKSDVRKKASDFFENEAELSESEWGSDDEDEKDLNRYEAELGDADKFDKDKLRGELERIRLREQIDQDSREIRILTERFIEEEDGGQERERKFRWKHLNNTDLNDDQNKNITQDEVGMDNSDDENEATWRRMRYEREQLLKQQMSGDKDVTIEQTSTTVGIAEQAINKTTTTTMILNSSKRISIIKPLGAATSNTTSPFLITNGGVNMMHYNRKSFLNRDSPILEKLASLSKTGADNNAILNKAKGKGNYVFVATEKKDSIKRKSDSETGNFGAGPMMNPSKKSKLDPNGAKLRPQTKAFFESLN